MTSRLLCIPQNVPNHHPVPCPAQKKETEDSTITHLNTGQGLTANITTAGLVLFASNLGVPVSTTHVSCGSIFGIGTVNRACRWKTVTVILAPWITTLPAAALFSGLLYLLLA